MTNRRSESDASKEGSSSAPAPLSELVDIVAERRERAGEAPFQALFAEQSYDAVDGESVWTEATPSADSTFGAIGEVIDEGERTYVVSKRNFCERCHHLSSPPSVRCTHEESEIREFVDKDHVRVSSCPIVHERGIDKDGHVG